VPTRYFHNPIFFPLRPWQHWGFYDRVPSGAAPSPILDEFAKSRQETMFVTYHEGHEEHEAEIIKYFLTLRVLRALRGENQTFYGFINPWRTIIKFTESAVFGGTNLKSLI
jgi:hypothetical protein